MPSQGSLNISDRPSASIRTELTAAGALTIKIAGRLDSTSTGNIWRETHRELDRISPVQVVVDASGIEYCDGSGIGLLFQLRRRLQKTGGVLEINGLKSVFQQRLDLFDPFEFEEVPIIKPGSGSPVEEIGGR